MSCKWLEWTDARKLEKQNWSSCLGMLSQRVLKGQASSLTAHHRPVPKVAQVSDVLRSLEQPLPPWQS